MYKPIAVWNKKVFTTLNAKKDQNWLSGVAYNSKSVDFRTNAKGFTLVELVVALSILVIVSLCLLPLLVHVAQANEANHNRLVATKLASSVIEQIRAMKFDDVGNQNNNDPHGLIPNTITKKINNVTFTIRTDISWDDPYKIYYKKVKVTVNAPDIFTGKDICYAELYTTVARNGD